ncbi:HdeD family acid-resistance protein [Leifsonia sp. NPDC014704]|uniref:HdeD family acid-resistance protein n=1 Tax=Leifsonia sp. NPDC014704 TaxID=3364123 RepID=UPI000EAC48E5
MTSANPINAVIHDFALDARNLTRSAINGIRAAIGVSGLLALVLGIVLLVQPIKTLAALAVILGIYFVIAGAIRLGMGVFSKGISAGIRALNVILGVLLVVAGIVIFRNSVAAAATLVIFAVAFIAVGWIIEGVIAITESVRTTTPAWPVAYGILSILAGIIMLFLPASSAVVLVVFAGIALIVLGAFGIVRAFTFGRNELNEQTE